MSEALAMTQSRQVHELSRDECIAQLRRNSLGRIAVSHRGLPQILPVNYAFDGTGVVFRTAEGGMLDRACHDAVVAFEVDDYDSGTRNGWSVMIIGTATVLDARSTLRAIELQLASAGAGDGTVFVKVVPGAISGRQVGAS